MLNILKLKTEKKKGKLFYGWVIVLVMAVANGAGSAMGTVNLGLFVKPMGNDIGIGRAMFGWAQTTRQTTGAFTSPIVGKLLDRYGARYLLPLSIAIAGLAMVGIGYAAHPWQVVVLFGVMGLFGLGTPAQLLTNVPIAKWFLRFRGRAMSYSSLGNAVGPMFLLPVTQLLITAFGWRHAWTILGISAIIIVCPLCILLMRRQ
ncbi:MAG: MFS transporter, partial [Dehalococcoidia bacterium]|nr:MFS transporter [Dehalococcoidia bacterium]